MRQNNSNKSPPTTSFARGERIVSAKQIAHDLGLDVRYVRAMLRARYTDHVQNTPWQWPEGKANSVRRYLMKVLGRGR